MGGGGGGGGTVHATPHTPMQAQPAQPHSSASAWNHSHDYGHHHNEFYNHNWHHHGGYYGGYYYDPGYVAYYPVPVADPMDGYAPQVDPTLNLPVNSDQMQGNAANGTQQAAAANNASLPKPKKQQAKKSQAVKPAQLASNKKPGASRISPYSEKVVTDAQQSVETEAISTLQQLEEQLPSDANIHDAIEVAKNAVEQGKPLPPNWIANLVACVKEAGGPTNKAKANQFAKLVPGLLDANNLLAQAIGLGADNGWKAPYACNLPIGPASVIVLPSLPTYMIVLMPTGSFMAGTGGQGCARVVSSDAASLLGLPLGAGDAVADVNSDTCKPTTRGILLRNPVGNSDSVNFVIDSQPSSSLDPDYTQEINDGNSHTIRFSRGTGAGEASYQLDAGTYASVATDNGWDLQQESFSVTVDNSRGTDDFNFVADNHQKKITAGNTQVINSNYPIVVRFNRGDAGVDGCKCITSPDAQLVVAVNPTDGLWDLYPGDSVAAKTANIAGGPSETTSQPKARTSLVLANAGAQP